MAKNRKKRVVRQAATSQQGTPTWVWIAVSGVVAVLLVAGLFYLGSQEEAVNQNIEGVEFFSDPGRGHVDGDIDYPNILPVTFADVPPGGVHNGIWQNCGIYNEPVRAENAVHSLEHGAVWITYDPSLPEDQLEILREVVRQQRRTRGTAMMLLSPLEGQSSPIVLTAWRVQLRVDDASDERIVEFARAYQVGPFTPEPGASCDRGEGEPLS